jgi:hypothetical protein
LTRRIPAASSGLEKAGIGGLKRDTWDSSQAEINGCGCIPLLFEKDPVSQNHCTVECEARSGTVPIDEIGDGAIIAALIAR